MFKIIIQLIYVLLYIIKYKVDANYKSRTNKYEETCTYKKIFSNAVIMSTYMYI